MAASFAAMHCLRLLALSGALSLFAPIALHAQGGLDPYRQGREAGEAALSAGNGAKALVDLGFALERAPDATARAELLAMLVQAAVLADDQDAAWVWTEAWVAAASDVRGRAKAPRPLAKAWPPAAAEASQSLAKARADALRALKAFRDKQARLKQAGAPLIAEWAEDLARAIISDADADALAQATAADFPPDLSVPWSVQDEVISGLEQLIRSAQAAGDDGMVIRAARCLRGMTSQAAFEKLQGDRPPALGGAAALANGALAEVRRKIRERGPEPWTIEALEALDEDQRRAFTLEHASFADPGVALSPEGRYRVETNCGFGTLLGTAETVELHHRRLVNWYGEDPFLDQQGIVRIVPESYGLEEEGAGFWWVGGFQGGNETTLKFTMSSIPALGRGLTHELTHRFDGAIYPGQPACFAEGRAVWTASSYGDMDDEHFVDDHVNFGTMRAVRRKGYSQLEELLKLIDGDIEDYRDNYSAGYALFVFLRSWPGLVPAEEGAVDVDGRPLGPDAADGPPIFAAPLEAFLKGRSRGKASARFAKLMADGKDGRPEDMEAFAALFDTFLRGFDGPRLARWTRIYDPVGPAGEGGEQVMDEPTFTWLRQRAEPYFGQDQARVAAELLQAKGALRDALAAYRWTLAVDEPSDAVLSDLQALLHELGQDDAAWVVAHWPRFSSPARRLAAEATPACPLLAALPELEALLAAQQAWVEAATTAGAPQAAAAVAADHDLLAARLGLPRLDRRLAPDAPAIGHPFHQPARLMASGSWHEDGLTDHEERRVEGLWLVADNGDVHVGRNKLRSGTDTMDRGAAWQDAFLLQDRWMEAGRYRLKLQVEQTTAMFTGGIVLGYTRRDRNLRFEFSGGDVDFATGKTAQREAGGALRWSLTGLYAREGAKTGAFAFDSGSTTVGMEFLVDGPTLTVYAQGREIASMSTLDARPIQGYLGFYTSYGAMRVVSPMVERLDRERPAGVAGSLGGGLDPWSPGVGRLRELIGRPVNGIPLSPAGTAILWFPNEKAERIQEVGLDGWRARIEEQTMRFLRDWQVELPAQGVTVVLPQALSEGEAEKLKQSFAAQTELLPRGGLRWAWHAPKEELSETRMTVGGWTRPLLVFADPAGLARSARRLATTGPAVPDEVFHLLQVYQDHSRPGMAGAAD